MYWGGGKVFCLCVFACVRISVSVKEIIWKRERVCRVINDNCHPSCLCRNKEALFNDESLVIAKQSTRGTDNLPFTSPWLRWTKSSLLRCLVAGGWQHTNKSRHPFVIHVRKGRARPTDRLLSPPPPTAPGALTKPSVNRELYGVWHLRVGEAVRGWASSRHRVESANKKAFSHQCSRKAGGLKGVGVARRYWWCLCMHFIYVFIPRLPLPGRKASSRSAMALVGFVQTV